MSEQLFDVVFFGILQAGKNKDTVMQNMAAMFKTDANKLAPYFAGGRKVIKGKINAVSAEKYKAALENVGLVIKVETCESKQDAKPEDTTNSNQAKADTDGISVAPVGADVIENPVEIPAQKIADISAVTMAETGADVIENPVKVPVQKIADISDVTMAETGADVIESPVEVPAQKIEDISSITMAEVGSDVLENPADVITQEIDELTDISLAETGADMIENPKPKEKADIPDTSGLSLDEETE